MSASVKVIECLLVVPVSVGMYIHGDHGVVGSKIVRKEAKSR